MADWPSTIPQIPLADGYSNGFANNLITSQVDYGPPKVRRRATSAMTPMSFSMRMTAGEFDDFKEFFEETLYSGSLSFNFPHPETGVDCVARFSPTQPPKWGSVGATDYMVSISLEVYP